MIPTNHFEFVIASSEYLYRKPNRRIFELALEKAELSASEVWYIGDQYECDIVGARNAGLFPVWYIGAADMRLPEDKRRVQGFALEGIAGVARDREWKRDLNLMRSSMRFRKKVALISFFRGISGKCLERDCQGTR